MLDGINTRQNSVNEAKSIAKYILLGIPLSFNVTERRPTLWNKFLSILTVCLAKLKTVRIIYQSCGKKYSIIFIRDRDNSEEKAILHYF